MKIATQEDLENVYTMAMNFVRVSPYKDLANPDIIKAIIQSHIDGPVTDKICICSPSEGFILATATAFLFGNHRIATEIAWWVEPDHRGTGLGKGLITAFEYWAKNIAGCDLLNMASLDKKIEKYYKTNGYILYERAYLKVV